MQKLKKQYSESENSENGNMFYYQHVQECAKILALIAASNTM